MKTLIIINDAPYGTEKAYNALRIANQLGRDHGTHPYRFTGNADHRLGGNPHPAVHMGIGSSVYAHFTGSFKTRGKHAFRNLVIGAINGLLVSVVFAVVQFHHANVGLPEKYDRWLRVLIVTPNMHRVHHSRWQPETDSYYSSLFSFWDRMAQTFRLNPKPETIKLGLEEFDSEEDQTLRGMMKTPVKNLKSNE